MSELVCLEIGIVLWVVHVLVQAGYAGSALNPDYLVGPRDQTLSPKGLLYPRATRALANYVENFTPFVAADLGLIATQHTGGWGATVWIVARIVYIPLYLSGVKIARTIVWAVSIVGLVMMLARLAGY
jgi:uncharacterized MAPEG superfamily protein